MLRTAPPPQDAAPVRRALDARACIADRLHTLGHPADLLTDDAVDEVAAYASGSMARLRTALASALFLAATEHAPRIDRSHVSRAIASLPQDAAPSAEPPAPIVSPRFRFNRPLPLIASGSAAAALLVVLLLASRPMHGPTPPATTPAIVRTPANPAPAAQQAAPPDEPKAAATAPLPPAPSQPPRLSAVTDAAPQTTGPVPANPPPEQVQAQQPPAPAPPAPSIAPPAPALAAASPPKAKPAALPSPTPANTTVVLRYRPNDQQAVDKLAFLTTRLKKGGYQRVFSYPLPAPSRGSAAVRGSAIEYFYAQDRPAALAVVTAMGSESPFHAALHKPGKALHLMAQAKAERPHPPGTVEAIIP